MAFSSMTAVPSSFMVSVPAWATGASLIGAMLMVTVPESLSRSPSAARKLIVSMPKRRWLFSESVAVKVIVTCVSSSVSAGDDREGHLGRSAQPLAIADRVGEGVIAEVARGRGVGDLDRPPVVLQVGIGALAMVP